jgi:transposase
VKEARENWRKEQPSLKNENLVFIDETGLNTKMTRLRGRSPKGERCVASVPHGHWKSTSLIAAIRINGMHAPFMIDGALNREGFLVYLKNVLCPELKPDDIVIMDNLSTHKGAEVEALIKATGASVRYLPAYSPDLNPIENAFSKLKSQLREKQARSAEVLMQAVAESLAKSTAEDCQGYFRHAHYGSN